MKVQRRIIILAGIGSLVVAIVSLYLGRAETLPPLSLQFQTYDRFSDGTYAAVCLLTNHTTKELQVIYPNNGDRVFCEFQDRRGGKLTVWTNTWGATYSATFLEPHSSHPVEIPLLEDGSRRAAVLVLQAPKRRTEPWRTIRRYWWKISPPNVQFLRVLYPGDLGSEAVVQAKSSFEREAKSKALKPP